MLNILLVDDEALARSRIKTLLARLSEEFPHRVQEVGFASQALELLKHHEKEPLFNLLLLDINMPGMMGNDAAQSVQKLLKPPVIIFITAHAEFAQAAFDIGVADYLTKPVRLERLRQALQRAQFVLNARERQAVVTTDTPKQASTPNKSKSEAPLSLETNKGVKIESEYILIQTRKSIERVHISEVLYCLAEQKYVTIYTKSKDYLYDGTLGDLQKQFEHELIRIHRSALVARNALCAIKKTGSQQEGEFWVAQLHGCDVALPISRRLLSTVKEALR